MVADKENTYHKTQKGKPKPKTETQIQNGSTRTRITKYKIESYNVKNWKFSLMPVIQNKHSKPGNRRAKP